MRVDTARTLPLLYIFLYLVPKLMGIRNIEHSQETIGETTTNSTRLRVRSHSDTAYNIPFAQPTGLIDSPESRTIAAAVCKAHCLKECIDNMRQKSVTNPSVGEVLKALSTVSTQLRAECVRLSPGLLYYEECDQACEADRPYAECVVMCETGDSPGGWSCLTGCRFLDAALKERPGECPPQGGPAIHRLLDFGERKEAGSVWSHKSGRRTKALPNQNLLEQSGNENIWRQEQLPTEVERQANLADSHKCTVDAECIQKHEKCCHSQCKKAVFREDIIPPLPTVQILESKSPPSFLLSWERGLGLTKNNLSDPIVYVLQVKTYFGQEFDSRLSSSWKTLMMSTLTGAQLSEPRVGWWYQFQVAAVNRWGSLGFEVPSPPVQLSSPKPQPPSPPQNLIDRLFTMQADGEIRVQVQWSPPAQSSIPVTEYRIYWGLDEPQLPEDPDFSDKPTQFVNTVPASETSVQLTNLLPDTLYRVQVLAMSEWGSTQLRSLPSNLFVRTPPTEHLRYRQSNTVHVFDTETPLRQGTSTGDSLPRNNHGQHREWNSQSLNEIDQCICDGKTKSSVILRSSTGLGKSRIRLRTDPAVFDGKEIRVRALLTEHAEAGSPITNPRSVQLTWTPQVCIETQPPDKSRFMRLPTELQNDPISAHRDADMRMQTGSTMVHLHPVNVNQTTMRQAECYIGQLRLNCRYLLEVAGVKSTTVAEGWEPKVEMRACLCTPSCAELQTSPWLPKITCEPEESELLELAQPRGLMYRLVSKQPLIYNITWLPVKNDRIFRPIGQRVGQPHAERKADLNARPADRNSWQQTQPEHSIGPQTVKYRVVWGPSRDKPINPNLWRFWPGLRPRLDPTLAETKVLRNGETSILIGPLIPEMQYVVKLQAISTDAHVHNDEDVAGHAASKSANAAHQTTADPYLLLTSKESYMYFETPKITSNQLHQSGLDGRLIRSGLTATSHCLLSNFFFVVVSAVSVMCNYQVFHPG